VRPRPRRRLGPFALAGWLFADLLLVLALVMMGDHADPLAYKRPTSRPSASPTPSPKPTGPRSVAKTRFTFHVSGSHDAALIRQIRRATSSRGTRQAAFVLTFGGTREGTVYAHRINKLLPRARPAMFDRDTATEDFLDLNAAADTAKVWVYFYTEPR
jgi:hypothetical protein